MFCQKCGCENENIAKFCVQCGYSFETGEKGNVQTSKPKNKKHINNESVEKKKKPNGCLIAVLVVFVLFTVLFSALINGDDNGSVTGNTNGSVQQNDSETIYKIGDTVTIQTSRGDYSLKFTGVRETTERNKYADDNPQRVVILEYEYKNISFDSDVVVSYLYFRTYDNNGNALSTYPDTSVKTTTNISQGKTATASVAYGLNSNDNIVTVDFYNITMESMHNAECTFKLTW